MIVETEPFFLDLFWFDFFFFIENKILLMTIEHRDGFNCGLLHIMNWFGQMTFEIKQKSQQKQTLWIYWFRAKLIQVWREFNDSNSNWKHFTKLNGSSEWNVYVRKVLCKRTEKIC